MTSPTGDPGEKKYNRHRYGHRCIRILSGRSRVSWEALSDRGNPKIPGRGPGGFTPGPDQSGNIFARTRTGRKKPARPEFSGPGNYPVAGTNYAEPVGPGFVKDGAPAPVSASCGGAGPDLYRLGGPGAGLVPDPSSGAGA